MNRAQETISIQSNQQTSPQQRAVIYCRVSAKSQETDGHGLESQETRCRQYAAAHGYEVVAVFPDTITGGGDFMQRPGMVSLLAFLDDQPDDDFVVIFDDLKRFARDTRFHLDLRDAFRKRGATIQCLNFKFDETPEGEFIETIMAAQGALERKQNGRQVAQKMKARMQGGYWVHRAPVGYRYETVKGRGKMLVPQEPLASIVREGLEGYASGRFQSQAEVTRFFASFPDFPRNRQGAIVQQRVTDILTQPVFTGHICSETYGITWLKAQHEPLISMATFDAIQERRNGTAKLPARKDIGDDFALRGFVCCADCGKPMRSCWAKGKYRPYPYYLCQTKGCESYGKSVARDKAEDAVGDIIKTLQPTQSLFTLCKALFKRAWDTRLHQAEEVRLSIVRHITATEKQVDTLLGRILTADNATIITAYEQKLAALEHEKARLHDDLECQQAPSKASFDEKLELALTFLENPWKLWASGDITLRRTVLKLVFADRLHYHRKTGARTPQISKPFKALEGVLGCQSRNGAQKRTRIMRKRS